MEFEFPYHLNYNTCTSTHISRISECLQIVACPLVFSVLVCFLLAAQVLWNELVKVN